MTITDNQKRVQKPAKHLRWSVLRKQLAILAKRPILDVWQGSEYAFDYYPNSN